MVRRASVGILLAACVASAACGPTVDLKKGVQVLDVSSGWYDAGIVNGQNKLVPSVSFKLKNVSDRNLNVLQVNVLFRRAAEKDEWGSAFFSVTGSEGLEPGATTRPLTAKSQLGYTGTDQSREEMLQNHLFVDARAELFAKYGSAQWTRLGEFPITRHLITR